ncbi:MAG: HAD-IIB family hydrolase [Cellulosilyticum sp.]|nr:HAD-IIB family hydrolase [Cellulosilyticum sp.]
MNKTIYISDLDGTLLNSQRQVSKSSVQLINELIEEKNVHFSVATARTPATVEYLLKEIKVQEPIIVMNGVALYDLTKHEYSQVEYFGERLAKEIISHLGDWIKHGFIYTIHNHRITAHYDQLIGKGRINFYEERKNLEYKKFTNDSITNYNEIIYFVFIDTKENIQAIYDLLESIEGIGMVRYKDIYCNESYLLEVYTTKATKANGVEKLKSKGQFTNVICFGDQLNDLNMFHEADEAYAVGNAAKEIKKVATAVIGTNDEDSVARFIYEHACHKDKEEEKC